MRHARGFEPVRPDLRRSEAQGFDVERGGAPARLVVEGIEPVTEVGRTDHPDATARLLIAQVVAERDEVDVVIGMEVADHHRLRVGGVDQAGQPRERALTEIEHEARADVAKQV